MLHGNGEPLHPSWHVHVVIEHLTVVNAPDAHDAEIKAIAKGAL